MMPDTAARTAPAPALPGGAFARLLSIDIRHDYCNHSDGRFDGIAIEPSPVTAERLSRYGLVVRRRTDGIDLFYNQAQAAALHNFIKALPDEVRRDPPEDLFGPPFLFVMRLNDPLFFNFTEAPTNVREGRPALVLTNRRLRKVEARSAEFQVSWDNKGAIVWGAQPRDLAGNPPAPTEISKQASPAPSTDLPAAPREMLAGALADAEAADRAEASDETARGLWLESRGEIASAEAELAGMQDRARRLPFGLITIHMIAARARASAGAWDGYPIDLQGTGGGSDEQAGIIRTARYALRFPARATYWRYLIAGRGELDHSSLVISDSGRTDLFAPAEPRALPDGRQASCLEATAPRPLLKRPQSPLVLTSGLKGGKDWQKVKTELPAATAESVLPDPHPPPGRCWSDIYVFV